METRYRAAFRKAERAARGAKTLTAARRAGKPETALFAGRYENSVIVAAAAPIFSADGKQVFGVIQLAQTADRWLTLRDRALTRLLNLTLFVTLFAVVAAFWFAGRMTLRISRLGAASETALGREGNLSRVLPEVRSHGRTRRSVAELLVAARAARRVHRLPAHARRQAGARDPYTADHHSLVARKPGVREPLLKWNGDNAKVYIARAREGSERLGAILTAMGAATRVEEAIAHSERQRFDLRALVRAAVGRLRRRLPATAFSLRSPRQKPSRSPARPISSSRCSTSSSTMPSISALMAPRSLSFCAQTSRHAELSVANPGPPLPPEAATRLFESLWQSRAESDKRPHFGLGLYIVRLIAEFHGGTARAANLPDGCGRDFHRSSDPVTGAARQGLLQPP